MKIELKDYKHSYYGSGEFSETYECWSDFMDEFEDADIDMNMVYRWDLYIDVDDGDDFFWTLDIFMVHQRKGYVSEQRINNIEEKDLSGINRFLITHYEYLQELWNPIR